MAKKRSPSIESDSEVVFAAAPGSKAPAPTSTGSSSFGTDATTTLAAPVDSSDGTTFQLLNDGQKLKHMVFEDSSDTGVFVSDGIPGHPTPEPTTPAASARGPAPLTRTTTTTTVDYGNRLAESSRTTPADRGGYDASMRREIDELGRPSEDLARGPTNLRPWRRTLYRTDGGAVSRYESSVGTSTLVTTRRDGDVMREERFHSRLVSPIIGEVVPESTPVTTTVTETVTTQVGDSAPTTTETVTVAETPKKKRRGIFGFFRGKHKPGEDSGDAFRPAVPVAPAPTPAVLETTTVTTTEEVDAEAGSAYYDYAGDDHEVIELEGVGPEYAERLQKQGIYTTSRLCYEDAAGVAERIGVPEKTVRTWQAMAQLCKINGVGPQYAEALARAGITGIEELKDRRSQSLAEQVSRYLDSLESTVVGQSVTAARIGKWKRAAASMRKVRQAIPSTSPPEKKLVRGHIAVLKNTKTKALGPPRKATKKTTKTTRTTTKKTVRRSR